MGALCVALGFLQAGCTFPDYAFAEQGAGGVGGIAQSGGGTGGDGGTGGQGGSGGTGGSGGSGGSGAAPNGGGGTGSSGGTGGAGGNPGTCDDGEKNGNETDKDCGGADCPGCAVDQVCAASSDCATNSCNPFSKKCEPSLKIECKCVNCAETQQTQSQVIFRLVNDGRESLPLEEFKLRYYFRKDQDETGMCSSAPFVGGCAQVIENDFPYTPATSEADRYIEVSFTSDAGELSNTDPTGEMTLTFAPSNGQPLNQQNDYSWSSSPAMAPCTEWTAWRIDTRDALVFGTPPLAAN